MTNPSPFSKVPGGKPDAPKGPHVDTEPPPGSLCPFLGGVAVPMVDDAKIIANPKANPMDAIQMGITYSVCQQARCHLWHSEIGACSLKVAALAQIKLARDLSAVAKKFGIVVEK